ncbi:MAG TPA: 2-oxoglutarate ferredoxin oxidoreductase subunit beta, partial [Nitrospirae bacterium]|nr:2-oxoglutarate ferredoxin oxidoreductase subunit beta [Nitrospirota bacterium]
MSVEYENYLRMNKFPHYWCPGCGNGVVLKAFIQAVDELGWKNNDIGMVTGIGCSSRASGYVDF